MKVLQSVLFLTLISASALNGCTSVSEGKGIIQDSNGRANGSATFSIKEEFDEDYAKVKAYLSNGEVYKGKFIIAKTEGTTLKKIYNPKTKRNEFTTDDITEYSSKASGLLFGSSGKTMKCTMTLSDPSGGFSGGGIGHCKLSTGQNIPLEFDEAD